MPVTYVAIFDRLCISHANFSPIRKLKLRILYYTMPMLIY